MPGKKTKLSQEQELKLRAYEAYIKRKNYLENIDLNNAADVAAKLQASMKPEWYKDYYNLKKIQAGIVDTVAVEDSLNEGLPLAKSTEELQPQAAPQQDDPQDLKKANAQLEAVNLIYDNPEYLLWNWKDYSWAMDKTQPKDRYVKPRVKNENDAPVYWNSENDFRRLEKFAFLGDSENEAPSEGVSEAVISWREQIVTDADQKRAAQALLKEKPSTLEEEEILVWKCLVLLGGQSYFNTENIGYDYGKVEDAKDWLKELREKSAKNGNKKAIADLKETIDKNNSIIIKESNRFSLFRDSGLIQRLKDKNEDLQKTIDEINAPLKKQQEYIDSLENAADNRRELRSKVYQLMMKTVNARRDVFADLKKGKLPDGTWDHSINTDGRAYDWLDKQQQGQAAGYRRMNLLSSALATVRSHNKIEQIMRTIDVAKKARESMESQINANVDALYAQKKSYGQICEWLPQEEAILAQTGKNIEANRATLKRLTEEYAEIHSKYTKKLNAFDNKELIKQTKALQEDTKYWEDRVPVLEKEIDTLDKKIKTLTKSQNELNEYIPLEEEKRSIQQEMAKVEKDTPILMQYNEMPMDFLTGKEELEDVNVTVTGLTQPGKELYAPIGLLRSYTLVKKQILDEYVKLNRSIVANGGKIQSKDYFACIDNCYKYYNSLAKDFSGKQKCFIESFDQEAYAKLYSEKAEEMFPAGSKKQCAPLYASKDFYGTVESSLAELKQNKNPKKLNLTLNDLSNKFEQFANRLRVECTLIKEQQTPERVSDCMELLKSQGTYSSKEINSWLTWRRSTKEKLSNDVAAISSLLQYSAADEEEKNDLLKIYDEIEKQDKRVDYLYINNKSLVTDKVTLDKQRQDLNIKMKAVDDKIASFKKDCPDTARLIEKHGSENLKKQIADTIANMEKEKRATIGVLKDAKKTPEKNSLKIEELQHKCSENIANKKIVEAEYEKEKNEFKKNHPEIDELDDELKKLDVAYTEKALEVEGYRGIVKKEIPEMYAQFVHLKNRVRDMNGRVEKLIGKDTNIADLWVEEENRYDLDKTHLYSGDFRKNTIDDLKVFFDNARTTTRILKKDDSEEYLAMMNAVADAVGKPKLRREWGPVEYTKQERKEAEGLSLNNGNLESCLTKLDNIVTAANAYIAAKGRQIRPIESDMRKKRLDAASNLKTRAELAINQLKGFPKKGETVGKDGLIDEISKMNNAYNSVVRSFGKSEKGKINDPFKIYDDSLKKYGLGKNETEKLVPDGNGGFHLITSNEQADYEAFFEACINPAVEQKKSELSNPNMDLPKNSHLYPEISAKEKEISNEKTADKTVDKTVDKTKKKDNVVQDKKEDAKEVKPVEKKKSGVLGFHK